MLKRTKAAELRSQAELARIADEADREVTRITEVAATRRGCGCAVPADDARLRRQPPVRTMGSSAQFSLNCDGNSTKSRGTLVPGTASLNELALVDIFHPPPY